MRVLVAEDDPGLRSVLERGLREHGYVVDAVADGDEALSYLRSYTYEAAVLDWRMPTVSGLDVVRTMRTRWRPDAGVDADRPGHHRRPGGGPQRGR